jgi:hypothetical protein
MLFSELINRFGRSRVHGKVLSHQLWIIFLFVYGCSFTDASLQTCPSGPGTATISSPCKFSPGIHSYVSLVITSDVYFDTTVASSRHILKVTQTLDIRSYATLNVGLNKESSNQGSGVSHSGGGTGGSFGGRGGAASSMNLNSTQAVPYGHPFNVSAPGSRGGGPGMGKGGGFLQMEARKVIINGSVKAPGGNAGGNGGGGSGGGIAVFCYEIDGAGEIEANGGLGLGTGGGGSGGRVSIMYSRGVFRMRTHAYGGKTGKL